MLSLNKYLKTSKLPIVVCLFLFKNTLLSQTNLIQNSSLEIDSNLQCTGSFTTIKFWDRINSIDYFTDSCHTNYRGIPINQVGESYPKHGIAYAGFVGYYTHPTIEIKEYLHQHLSYSLKQDTTYCLSFFISLADKSPLAIKSIGAYFTPNTTNTGSLWYISATPQVQNTSGFVTDTVNWQEIKGCFTAQGGEEYITIGNFNSNANTDTVPANPISPLTGTGNHIAYYYLDSITLWQNNFPTAIKEIGKEDGFNVYPNPASSVITIKIAENSTAIGTYKISITDILGREVKQLNFEKSIDISDLEKGIYFVAIVQSNKTLGVKKIIKE